MNLDWLAGFFDGEGGISVHPATWTVCVSLTNRDELALVNILQEFPEGTIDTRKRKEEWAPTTEVRWYGKRAVSFLLAIEDHTVIKKTQIGLALRLISLIGETGDNKADNLQERYRLAEEIDGLNTRHKKSFTQRRVDYQQQRVISKLGVSREQLLKAVEDMKNAEPKP